MTAFGSVQQQTLEEVRDAVERVIAFGPGLAMVEPFATLLSLIRREELPKGTLPIVESSLERLCEFVQGWNRAEDKGKRGDFQARHEAATNLQAAVERFRRSFDPDATVVRRRT